MARVLIIIGILLVLIGLVWLYIPGLINWFGKLPGDIHIKRENSQVFIPITSMIIASVVLTVMINLIKRYLG